MAITATVSEGTALTKSTENQVLEISFSTSAAISYAAGKVYFTAHLTDSTTTTPLEQDVSFAITYASAGSLSTSTPTVFYFENTMNLVPDINATEGAIYYHAVS